MCRQLRERHARLTVQSDVQLHANDRLTAMRLDDAICLMIEIALGLLLRFTDENAEE